VIEYDLASQLQLFRTLGRSVKSAALAVKRAAVSVKDELVDHWPIGAVVGTGLIAFAIVRRRRRRPSALEGGRSRKARVRSTVAAVFDQVVIALGKAGVARDAALTPRELARRMTQRAEPGAAQLGELVELYYAAEWGGRRDPAAEDRAAVLAGEIRDALDAARSARRRA
jgi:hypothetical protein